MSKEIKEVKKFNIVRKATEETYTNRNGEEKTPWKQVGEMTRFEYADGGRNYIIKLNHLPDTFSVFENDYKKEVKEVDKVATDINQEVVSNEPTVEYPTEEISPEDIPF